MSVCKSLQITFFVSLAFQSKSDSCSEIMRIASKVNSIDAKKRKMSAAKAEGGGRRLIHLLITFLGSRSSIAARRNQINFTSTQLNLFIVIFLSGAAAAARSMAGNKDLFRVHLISYAYYCHFSFGCPFHPRGAERASRDTCGVASEGISAAVRRR